MLSLFSLASSQLSLRIENMKLAEAALISFALERFHDYDPNHNRHGTSNSVNVGPTHSLETFDTPIARSVVPLKKKKKCFNKDDDEKEEDHFIIHGVKATSHVYSNKGMDNHQDHAPLVMLHGYANGALYFYRNLLGLANHAPGGKVFAIDVLGWGLSSRPPFQIDSENDKIMKDKNHDSNDKYQTYATEQIFVESLEAWRKAQNIDKMTLAGHSIGGYISVAYSEKYPQNVERLILISPAGVPDDQDVDIEGQFKKRPLTFRLMAGTARRLFDYGTTPSSFLRKLSEKRGKSMVESYVKRRLPAITCPEEQEHLTEYLYTNSILPGSGEDCLNKLLKPTAFARKPTLHRIPALKVKDVSFIYGQNDWMDPSGGVDAMKKCQELKTQGREAPNVQVYGVRDAGHLLMLENWKEFNSAVIQSCGRGKSLPSAAPMPHMVTGYSSSQFFTQPRWGKNSNAADDDSEIEVDSEDKA